MKQRKGILTATMIPKMSKMIDKDYWWMKDKIKQVEYHLYWKCWRENWADYFTKHYPPLKHKMMRKKYLVANRIRIIKALRGCVALQAQVNKIRVEEEAKINEELNA